jgi:hypothetical protein
MLASIEDGARQTTPDRSSTGFLSLVTGDSGKSVLLSLADTQFLPGSREGRSKMSLYQTGLDELRPRALAPALVLANSFARVKAEFLLAARTRRVADTLFVFALVILPMIAFIALLFLLSSADPTAAVAGAVDATGMLILPP